MESISIYSEGRGLVPERKFAWVCCLAVIMSFSSVLWVDHYGGTIWLDSRYIMPQPGAFTCDDGTVMLPFRAVMEGLFCLDVTWEENSRIITVEENGQVIYEVSLDEQCVVVVENRAYAPLDWFSDWLPEK